MFPTCPLFSKASRLPMIPKLGNKDYYKGTRAAYLPGGHRTGAPGKHIIRGRGKYRLVDEKVRFFVAPPIEDMIDTSLKPYVHSGTNPGRSRHFRGAIDRALYSRLAPVPKSPPL